MAIAPTMLLLTTLQETPARRLALPTPSNITWNQGIEEQIYTQRNAIGELQFDEAMVTQRQPAVTAEYSRMTKELMALKIGNLLKQEAANGVPIVNSFRVNRRTYAGAAAGFEGNSIAANSTNTQAFYLNNGISEPLTRVATGTFDPEADLLSFAQDANFALSFSDDVVALRPWVTVFGRYDSATADVLSEDLFNIFRMLIFGVLQDQGKKEVFYLEFDPVELNRQENSEINFGGDTVPLAFRITELSCKPKLIFPRRQRKC
ncbi:hypothetical protein GS597_01455 [Synechococcales cyanobacterium C]|uniref:Uncharacterized protein n=1 Tax=Petrachloros mirabilis ULC683 TaxID=2781853 RepID=A0A8K1ZW35_9CYAN|nr:hypothetical protein [Petrachloros mirabilis]NCJ05206.1 hypothetical protein [Petrachloros mirabilis ULC683]